MKIEMILIGCQAPSGGRKIDTCRTSCAVSVAVPPGLKKCRSRGWDAPHLGTECHGWFRPAKSAVGTRRVCSAGCRRRRCRRLARPAGGGLDCHYSRAPGAGTAISSSSSGREENGGKESKMPDEKKKILKRHES